nr:putative nuclease HARBI1 [Helicoverpa armigera]
MSLVRDILWESSSSDDENYNDLPNSRKKKVYQPRVNRFLKWNEQEFLDRFRISKGLARALASHLAPLLQTRTMKNFAVTPEQQIIMALEFYACGSFQRCIGDAAGVHKSTVCRIIHRVSRAIAGLRTDWIAMPKNIEEMETEAKKFYEICAFPKVIGTIDCTHIPIKSPGGADAETYRNRKQVFSLNVQVITNAEMYITNIVARWPGSCHDSHIFNSSVIKGRLEDGEFDGFWLLGDKGYANKPYLLTPLRNPVTEAEKLYNESHIRTRNIVERSFGCWKKRFPAVSWKLRTNTARAQCAIVAMAVLYNICKKLRDPMPTCYDSDNTSLHDFCS